MVFPLIRITITPSSANGSGSKDNEKLKLIKFELNL